MSHIFSRGLHVLTILSSVNSTSRLLSTASHFWHHMWQVFKKTSKVFIKYMIKSEYKFLYVYDYSFLVDLSCSYVIFSIKSRPLNINIQRKFFLKIDYNIAFVNSERWLAKSRVDITLCQHGKFPATLLLKFFVLYRVSQKNPKTIENDLLLEFQCLALNWIHEWVNYWHNRIINSNTQC